MTRINNSEETKQRIIEVASRLFVEKSYEHTTIADIVAELGDLSKGAVYHHFKSKEEILEAVGEATSFDFQELIDDINSRKDLNGLEKINALFMGAVQDKGQELIIDIAPNALKIPQFLVGQLIGAVKYIAPEVKKLIDEGIEDGSIITEFPKESSEAINLLMGIWANPLIFDVTKEELYRKYLYLNHLTTLLGIPIDVTSMFDRTVYLRQIAIDARLKISEENENDNNN